MSEDEQTEDRSPLGQMKATIAASFGRDSRQYLRDMLDRAYALGAERRSAQGAAFDAIAGAVGMDAFGGANPREVYLRVSRMLKEHERMRAALARIHDDSAELARLLCDVEGEVARD